MRNALIAFVIATTMTGVARAQTARDDGRAGLLSPPNQVFNRVIDPVRANHAARAWTSRFPIGSRTPVEEGTRLEPGPAGYGAPVDAGPRVIHVRIGVQAVAIDPWATIEGRGDLADLERARNEWLREQGYVQRVRVHVNDALRNAREPMPLPGPRAVIRIHTDEDTHDDAPVPMARVSLPPGAPALGPARVVVPTDLALRDPRTIPRRDPAPPPTTDGAGDT